MKVYCEAILDNSLQKNNLCQCIEILGCKPVVYADRVEVTFDKEYEKAEKLIELFEHYNRRTIRLTSK